MVEKSEWEKNHEKKQKKQITDRNKGINSMTEKQRELVQKTYTIMSDVLTNIYDMDDIYLSDIREMNSVMWKLKHEFNLESYNG